MMRTLAFAFLIALSFQGCKQESGRPTEIARLGDARRGRGIYLANCAACHNADPSKVGSVGPAIKGSSRELLEARVLKSSYPPGYVPKRQTSIMPPQPYLKSALPDLAAFLESSS